MEALDGTDPKSSLPDNPEEGKGALTQYPPGRLIVAKSRSVYNHQISKVLIKPREGQFLHQQKAQLEPEDIITSMDNNYGKWKTSKVSEKSILLSFELTAILITRSKDFQGH